MPDDFKLPEEWADLAVRAMNDNIVLSDREIVAAVFSAITPHVRELVEALRAAEKADTIHSECDECMEYGQAPEVCGDCFPSADDARVMRRNALAKFRGGSND